MHTLQMARRPTPSCWDGKYFLKCGSHPPEEENSSTFYLFMFDYLFDYLLSWLHHWKDILHLSIHQSRYPSPFLALTRSHTHFSNHWSCLVLYDGHFLTMKIRSECLCALCWGGWGVMWCCHPETSPPSRLLRNDWRLVSTEWLGSETKCRPGTAAGAPVRGDPAVAAAGKAAHPGPRGCTSNRWPREPGPWPSTTQFRSDRTAWRSTALCFSSVKTT